MKNINVMRVIAMIAMSCTAVFAVEKGDKSVEAVAVQKTCPVMGGKINKALYVDYEGQRIYVCCAGCIPKIKKDPAKYIKILTYKGEGVAKLQTKCPVMGGSVNKKQYADVKGKRIYVCCAGCIAKIKADPDKYIGVLEKQGFVLDDIPVEKPIE